MKWGFRTAPLVISQLVFNYFQLIFSSHVCISLTIVAICNYSSALLIFGHFNVKESLFYINLILSDLSNELHEPHVARSYRYASIYLLSDVALLK